MREHGSGFFSNEITRNPWVWGALVLCLLLLAAALYIPVLSDVLVLSDPGPNGWLVIAIMTLAPWILVQVYKSIRRR